MLPRKWMQAALIAAALFAIPGCGFDLPKPDDSMPGEDYSEGDAFDWKAYEGTRIKVILAQHPWASLVQGHIGEFEELTGIKVNLEIFPEQQARQKLAVVLAAGGQDVDAFMTAIHNERYWYHQSGWYEDLGKYLNDPRMTFAGYDFHDLFEGTRNLGVAPDGTVTSIPFTVNPMIFYYRKDLFEQAGLHPPRTLDEVRAYAEILHRPPEVYGFVNRGLRNANVYPWATILREMGGDFFAVDGKNPALNSEAAVRATEWYGRMLREFGPPGVTGFNWNESIAFFAQGRAAMGYESANFTAVFEDPEQSAVAGRVGYMLVPPDARTGIVDASSGAAGLAVSKGSTKKEAAWYFVQWATGKEMMLRAQLAGVGTSRRSAWESEEFKHNTKMPADWIEAFQEALNITGLWIPPLKGTNEFRDILGIEIQSVIQGADPRTAMDRAQKAVEEFMARESRGVR